MMPPTMLETARLRLRQWQEEDYAPFAQLNADPEVMEYFPAVLDRAASDQLADRIRNDIDERGWGLWAVEVKRRAPFIGFVGLNVPLDDLPYQPCVEIGWRLQTSHWGKGFATEAARAALGFAFGEIGLDEVVAFTSTLNRRSIAVMLRIGMKDTGRDFEHPRVAAGHRLRRHVLYSVSRPDRT